MVVLALLASCVVPVVTGVGAGVADAAPIVAAAEQAEASGEDVVRLVIDDPVVAAEVAATTGTELAVDNALFGVVEVAPDEALEVAEAAFDAGATAVEPDARVSLAGYVPTDPGWPDWWSARQARLDDAWERGFGTPSVRIAVIDTGVNVQPELSGRVRSGYTTVGGSPTVDTDGHGTQAAMVAAGGISNGSGASGACPLCEIIPIKVVPNNVNSASLADVADGIVWAVNNNADVINISLAGSQTISALGDAIALARNNDVIVVAAAGNDGGTTPRYPAAEEYVVSVGGMTGNASMDVATLRTQPLATGSNRGSWVDVAVGYTNVTAPPNDTIAPPQAWGNWSGTSTSSPLVAGSLGLYLTLAPGTPVDTMRAHLQSASPNSAPTINVAWGRLDVAALLTLARAPWPRAPLTDVVRPSFWATAVDWGYDLGILTGAGPGGNQFLPTNIVNRAQAFTMLWRLEGSPQPTIPNPFSDVPAGAYYEKAATWAYEDGVTTGTAPGVFSPFQQLNRAQAVTTLWRFVGSPPVPGPNPFPDVPSGLFYSVASAWGFNEGIVTGINGNFTPGLAIPRSQHITVLWRYSGAPAGPTPP